MFQSIISKNIRIGILLFSIPMVWSCSKDDGGTTAVENIIPEIVISDITATPISVGFLLKLHGEDGDITLAEYSVKNTISGVTLPKAVLNSDDIALAEGNGLSVDLIDLAENTTYQIAFIIQDNDGGKAQDTLMKLTSLLPEPILTHDIQTTLNPNSETYVDSVNAAPLADETEIFGGTITTELTSDGGIVAFNPALHEIKLILGGVDANKFDVVVSGNTYQLLLNADYYTDNPNSKETVADIADGLNVSIKAELINKADGAVLATGDVDTANKSVEDTGNSKIWTTNIEKTNGDLKDEYLDTYALMQNNLSPTSYNNFALTQVTAADIDLFEAGQNVDGYDHLKIKTGVHAGKYIDLGQLGKITKSLVLTDNSVWGAGNPNITKIGGVLAKALTTNPELFSTYYSGADGETVFLTDLQDKQMLAGVCGVEIFE